MSWLMPALGHGQKVQVMWSACLDEEECRVGRGSRSGDRLGGRGGLPGREAEPGPSGQHVGLRGRRLRLVAGLSPSLGALAERLRLDIERSWEDPLGEVEAAMF